MFLLKLIHVGSWACHRRRRAHLIGRPCRREDQSVFRLPPYHCLLIHPTIVLLGQKRDDENKIRDLDGEIGKIKETRARLDKDGGVALTTFTTNVGVIQKVWGKVVNDANEIKDWLDDGAKSAVSFFGCGAEVAKHLWQDYPKYMEKNLKEGVRVYSKVGKYLRDYADGVTETVKTFKV